MSAVLPVRLDPFKVADRGETLRGAIPLAELSRLVASLLDSSGEAECEWSFYRDTDGTRKLRLSYRADLVLSCQRCLGALRQRVEGESELRLIDAELQSAEGDEDVLAVGVEGLYLKDVLEDELLLALPLIPRHATTDACEPEAIGWLRPSAAEHANETQTENPFDILKNLKH